MKMIALLIIVLANSGATNLDRWTTAVDMIKLKMFPATDAVADRDKTGTNGCSENEPSLQPAGGQQVTNLSFSAAEGTGLERTLFRIRLRQS